MNRGRKKFLQRAGLFLAAAFCLLQFFRPEKNLSSPTSFDLFAIHPAPPEVKQLLTVACYDCHSNHTRYPWYAEIQPLGWWLAQHVRDGKQELNFSEFGSLSAKRAKNKLEACIDELEAKNMPLPSYTIAHRDARLSEAQRQTLTAWLEEVLERVEANSAAP
ncbi:MAG: heme-binding domain-containing protein [Nibricoccus sp.]